MVRPTPAKAQMLAVILAPMECKLGISVSPAVTSAGALQVDPGGCRLRTAMPALTTTITAKIAENAREILRMPIGVGSVWVTAVAPATNRYGRGEK